MYSYVLYFTENSIINACYSLEQKNIQTQINKQYTVCIHIKNKKHTDNY